MSRDPSRRQVLASTAALPLGACGARATLQARIGLDPASQGAPVPPLLFGSNLQWTSAGDGALIPGAAGATFWDPTFLKLVVDGGFSLLRFPGGALANTYHWRHGAGPRAARDPGLDFTGRPEASVFGTDELIDLANRTGTQLLITTNVSAGAEEAADWVEYLNGSSSTGLGALRVRNTGAQPVGVRFWEVGNELYSPKEPGHTAAATYASTVVAFREAMRRRDPAVQVGAMLEGSFQSAAWMANVMPELPTWNAAVLDGCARDIDFVSLHFSAPYDTLWSDGDLRQLTLAGPLILSRTINQVKTLLEKCGRPTLPIIVSEYTAFYGGTPSARIAGVEGALFDTLVLFELMRQQTVVGAANWSLLNDGAFGLISGAGGRLRPRASYTALLLLRTLAGLPTLPMRITGPAYEVQAKGNVPHLAAAPILDGAAVVVSPGHYRLAIVNRSASTGALAHLEDGLRILSGTIRLDGGADWSPPTAVIAESSAVTLPPGSLALLDIRT